MASSRDIYYAERLSRMIQCKTVSVKDRFEQEEFFKLREVIKDLFPMFVSEAELVILGDDAWLYKLKGKDETRNVMLMSHHDVVDAEGEWEHDAFSGEIASEKLWGRGTVDTKTPLFAEFTALQELLTEGFVPSTNVYLFSSHNEEIAGDGALLALDYFRENNIEFEWIIDEGGAIIDPPMAGIDKKCAMMAVHEKGRCVMKFTASKNTGHTGLAADSKTPAVKIANFITEVEKTKPFIRRMHPELRAMFEGLAPHMSFPMKFIFSHLNIFSGLLVKIIPKLNAAAGEMLGTSGTFRKLESAEDGGASVEYFLRCVNDKYQEEDIKKLEAIAKNAGISSEITEMEYYRPANLNSAGYEYIKGITKASFDYAACAPFILPAGTDARRFCDLSDAVVRFAPIDIDSQQYASVHNLNENINVDKIALAVDFYKKLIREYK